MNEEIFKNEGSEKAVADKVKTWIQGFASECALFKVANEWDEFWRVYREVPLLTLLATGLARTDTSVSILREYPVYSKGSYIGSSDLFLNYHNEKMHFFIEAKYERSSWNTGFFEWSDENYNKFIALTKSQLDSYVMAEKKKEAISFSVILLFYMLDFSDEKSYHKYLELAKISALKNGQFYYTLLAENPEKSPYDKFGTLEIIGQVESVQS